MHLLIEPAEKILMRKQASSPLVTVVIPSYNHEKYVKNAIESVFDQCYTLVELIVIDDGSIDGSPKIISELSKKYSFDFIARDNKGLAKTLNEGINLAKGKYICFLASDDYYLPNRIESAVHVLERSDEGVFAACCDGLIVNGDGKLVAKFGEKFPRPLIGGIYKNMLIGNWLPALGMTYKLCVLRRYMFDENFRVEDYSLYLKMFSKEGGRLIYQKELGFAYRWHATNSSKNREIMNAEFKLIYAQFRNAGSFQSFKKKIHELSIPDREDVNLINLVVLFLALIRKLQLRFVVFKEKMGFSSSFHIGL